MASIKERRPRKITVLYPLPNTKDNPEKSLKRVAAYCRVSSRSEEQMESLHAQVAYYEKHIKEHPEYSFAGIYTDEGITGTSLLKREAFKRMLRDATSGHIDMIITKSLSRFGRNTVDCLNSLRDLKSLGVDVYFEKENIHSLRSEGELLITLISAIAESESLALSENVKWGKRRKYERGDIGSIPWKNITGYDKNETGEVVIIEEQATIVRRVYDEFLSGYGPQKIAQRLNQEHIPHVNGGRRWECCHITGMLTNEKYKGHIKFQKRLITDPLTKKQIFNKGQLPQYYCMDSHPAIVESSTWECVQQESKRQKNYCKKHFTSQYHHARHESTLPLTGKIVCGHCGHLYKITVSNRRLDKGKKYYMCRNYRSGYRIEPKPGSCCNSKLITPLEAENIFISAWNHLVDEKESYLPEWQQTMDGKDLLQAYRGRELIRLVQEVEYIDAMPYALMLKTLDHIEVGVDGRVETVFQAGIRIK
ncbi:MAG: recombinase family protein [Clostridiaceae bacterium]|nr:recombinase family protein [Clostridiaceae bacterium]